MFVKLGMVLFHYNFIIKYNFYSYENNKKLNNFSPISVLQHNYKKQILTYVTGKYMLYYNKDRDHMVVGFTTTYAISAYHY